MARVRSTGALNVATFRRILLHIALIRCGQDHEYAIRESSTDNERVAFRHRNKRAAMGAGESACGDRTTPRDALCERDEAMLPSVWMCSCQQDDEVLQPQCRPARLVCSAVSALMLTRSFPLSRSFPHQLDCFCVRPPFSGRLKETDVSAHAKACSS